MRAYLSKLNKMQAVILGLMIAGVIAQLIFIVAGLMLPAVFMAMPIALGAIAITQIGKKEDGDAPG